MLDFEMAKKYVKRFKESHKGLEDTKFLTFPTQEDAFPKASEEWHRENTVTGTYFPASNIVVVIANNNRDLEELNKTLRHEVFGHLALNRLKEFDKMVLLETIANAPKHSEIGIHRDMLLSNEYSNYKDEPLRLAEEVVAHTAERSFSTIERFISIPDPKYIETNKDLLNLIDALKNGIHHGVLEQQIFPKSNDAQFRIKENDMDMSKYYTIRQGKIIEVPEDKVKSHETKFDSYIEAIRYTINSGNEHNLSDSEKQFFQKISALYQEHAFYVDSKQGNNKERANMVMGEIKDLEKEYKSPTKEPTHTDKLKEFIAAKKSTPVSQIQEISQGRER